LRIEQTLRLRLSGDGLRKIQLYRNAHNTLSTRDARATHFQDSFGRPSACLFPFPPAITYHEYTVPVNLCRYVFPSSVLRVNTLHRFCRAPFSERILMSLSRRFNKVLV
jgi:hypothetical protein